MKKLITILCLIPSITFAQKFQANILGGAVYNSTKLGNHPSASETSPIGSFAASLKIVGSKTASTYIGGYADVFSLKYRPNKNQKFPEMPDSKFTPNRTMFRTAVNFGIVVTEKISIGNGAIVFGANAGLIFGSRWQYKIANNPTPGKIDDVITTDGISATTIGINLGYERSLSNLISLVAQLSPKYIISTEKTNMGYDNKFKTVSAPILIGIGIKL